MLVPVEERPRPDAGGRDAQRQTGRGVVEVVDAARREASRGSSARWRRECGLWICGWASPTPDGAASSGVEPSVHHGFVTMCYHGIPKRSKIGRDDRIRTSDPLTPSQVRYQAAPHPEICSIRRNFGLAEARRRTACPSASRRSYESFLLLRGLRGLHGLRALLRRDFRRRELERLRAWATAADDGCSRQHHRSLSQPRFTCRIRSRASLPQQLAEPVDSVAAGAGCSSAASAAPPRASTPRRTAGA